VAQKLPLEWSPEQPFMLKPIDNGGDWFEGSKCILTTACEISLVASIGAPMSNLQGTQSYKEWARIQPFLPGLAPSGRPVGTDLREVLNATRYLARSGGGWRMLPKDFPPWQTVYWWFRRFVRRFCSRRSTTWR
jgi:hypothetical protein